MAWADIERHEERGDIGALIRVLRRGGFYLKSKRSWRRGAAATALGRLKAPAAVEPLIRALHNPDSFVRWGAASALGQIGDSRAIAPLLGLIEDESYRVRGEVGQALARLGEPRGFDLLVSVMKEASDPRAAEALGRLGDQRAVEHLVRALDSPHHELREAARTALRTNGWKNDTEIERIEHESWLRQRPEPCEHERVFANQLCIDCGGPLDRCLRCGASLHVQPNSDCQLAH